LKTHKPQPTSCHPDRLCGAWLQLQDNFLNKLVYKHKGQEPALYRAVLLKYEVDHEELTKQMEDGKGGEEEEEAEAEEEEEAELEPQPEAAATPGDEDGRAASPDEAADGGDDASLEAASARVERAQSLADQDGEDDDDGDGESDGHRLEAPCSPLTSDCQRC
jgi:hypothetical protein